MLNSAGAFFYAYLVIQAPDGYRLLGDGKAVGAAAFAAAPTARGVES